ncbi:methyl-accepting chemotaxis protein [Methanomethylovorans sp.]|uniref:methyl-accepting chemotaxis protein n=1 Tax=Methanomethylovorans sp. TaxID=2758717 RepID=UPI00351BF052
MDFKSISISHKILVMALILTILPATIVGFYAYEETSNAIHTQLNERLDEQVQMEKEYVDAVYSAASEALKYDMSKASSSFYSYGSPRISDEKIMFGDGYIVNGNYEIVDSIKEETGGEVTVFQVEDSLATRVSTTIVDENGKRVIGTSLSNTVYDAVVQKGQTYKGIADVLGESYLSIYEPIKDSSGKIIGVLFVGIPEEDYRLVIKKQMSEIQFGETGYMYAMDSTGNLIIHPAKEGESLYAEDFAKEMISSKEGMSTYNWLGRDKMVSYTYYEPTDWIIASGTYIDEFEAPVVAIRNSIISAVIVFIILGSAFALLINRSISGGIGSMVKDFKQISADALEGKINTRASTDVGVDFVAIPTGLNEILKSLTDIISSVSINANQVAMTAETMSASIQEMTAASSQIANTVTELAKGSQDQSSKTDEVAHAMGDMTKTVQDVASNSQKAADTATQSNDMIQSMGKSTGELLGKMAAIQEAEAEAAETIMNLDKKSSQISEIVDLITSIADQTNLLALNAAIEAARAGEHGRGFAVVADEVRKLAEDSGNAAKQISSLIHDMQAGTNTAVNSIQKSSQEVSKGSLALNQAVEGMKNVVAAGNNIATMVQEIAAAAEQQSASIEEITSSVDEVAAISQEAAAGTQEASAAVEEQNAAMQELAKNSQELAMMASNMQEIVAKYAQNK